MANIRITQTAAQDLLAGYQFYERQQKMIGRYFLECLSADINKLRHTAGAHLKPFPKIYRALSKHFPFAIYYRQGNQEVVVMAVLDCRQDPQSIVNRFS